MNAEEIRAMFNDAPKNIKQQVENLSDDELLDIHNAAVADGVSPKALIVAKIISKTI